MKKNILLAIIFLLPLFAKAQTRDAQLWENIYFEKNLSRNFQVRVNHEGRLTDNFSHFGYGYLDMGLSHQWNKHLRTALDYVFVVKQHIQPELNIRHQFYFAAIYKQKFGPFTSYLREMVQEEVQDIHRSSEGGVPDWYLRNKLTVRYNPPRGRITPYFATELYYHTSRNSPVGNEFDRARYFLGGFYLLNPVDQIEGYYMIEQHFNVTDPATNFVIGVGFQHSFY